MTGRDVAGAPARVRWAAEQLDGDPARRVVEIGCGAGHLVALLCAGRADRVVTAVDRSALQVARARALNAEHVRAARARIERSALDDAPGALGAGAFDAAVAVNVNAFWTEPAAALSSLRRLLAPGARAYLVYEPPSASAVERVRERIAAAAGGAELGVDDVRTTSPTARARVCVVLRAPG